jgi:hypothetical protein
LLQVSVSLRRVDSVFGEETSLNIAKKTPRGPRIPQEPVSYAHTLGEVPQLPSGFSLPRPCPDISTETHPVAPDWSRQSVSALQSDFRRLGTSWQRRVIKNPKLHPMMAECDFLSFSAMQVDEKLN